MKEVEDLDKIFYFSLLLYWTAAISFYSLKFLSPYLNDITSYGKFQHSHEKSILFPISNKVGWITFYSLGWLWNAFILFYLLKKGILQETSYSRCTPILFNLLMQIQLTRRLYETLFVQKFSPHRMHSLAFIAGCSFYTFACSSVICNDYINKTCDKSIDTLNGVVALVLFFFGSYMQNRCHVILANLRNNKKEDKKYSIPNGFFFNFVSCPHYLAELIIYSSFIIATHGTNILIWLLFAFVTLNLTHSAIRTHQWYKLTFKNYNIKRKVLIPFIL